MYTAIFIYIYIYVVVKVKGEKEKRETERDREREREREKTHQQYGRLSEKPAPPGRFFHSRREIVFNIQTYFCLVNAVK